MSLRFVSPKIAYTPAGTPVAVITVTDPPPATFVGPFWRSHSIADPAAVAELPVGPPAASVLSALAVSLLVPTEPLASWLAPIAPPLICLPVIVAAWMFVPVTTPLPICELEERNAQIA